MGTDGQTGRHLLLAGIITAFSVILIMTHTSQPKTAYHYDFISLAIVKIK